MGLGLKEMPPPGADRRSQGQRSNEEEGWRTDLTLKLCYHVMNEYRGNG